jgi:hypothetical protein
MNERIRKLAFQAMSINQKVSDDSFFVEVSKLNEFEKFAELILANADELKRMMNTDPINKPFELNPKFIAKCDELGRSRRQFQ